MDKSKVKRLKWNVNFAFYPKINFLDTPWTSLQLCQMCVCVQHMPDTDLDLQPILLRPYFRLWRWLKVIAGHWKTNWEFCLLFWYWLFMQRGSFALKYSHHGYQRCMAIIAKCSDFILEVHLSLNCSSSD